MADPTPSQLIRFWQLAALGHIDRDRFEDFLVKAETALVEERGERIAKSSSVPAASAEEQRRFRRELDVAGGSYIDILVPKKPGGKGGTRLYGVLSNHGVSVDGNWVYPSSIRVLVKLTEQQIGKMHGIGSGSLEYLKARLALAGLRLGMWPDEIDEAFRSAAEAS